MLTPMELKWVLGDLDTRLHQYQRDVLNSSIRICAWGDVADLVSGLIDTECVGSVLEFLRFNPGYFRRARD